MKEVIFLLSKKDNRKNIEKLLISHRTYLGEQFEAFVDEINNVNYEYKMKKEQLPKYPAGVLDAIAFWIDRKEIKKRTPKVDVFFIFFH